MLFIGEVLNGVKGSVALCEPSRNSRDEFVCTIFAQHPYRVEVNPNRTIY